MTQRAKFSLFILSGIAAMGGLLWMRSLASWRPVKMGEINYELGGLSFLSRDGKTAVIHGDAFDYRSIAYLEKGIQVDWPWPEQLMDGTCFSQKSPEYLFSLNMRSELGELRIREIGSGIVKRNIHWDTEAKRQSPQILLDQEEKKVSVVDAPHLFQWHIESGKLLHHVKLENPFPLNWNSFVRFALSSDGQRLVGCTEGQGRIWNTQSGKVITSWTSVTKSVPVGFSPDARVVIYFPRSYQSIYSFVGTSTGKVRWKLKGMIPKPFSDGGHEMWFPQKTNCEVRDALTGKIKRYTASPRQSDGDILRVTEDYIYTQNDAGEVFRWRAR